MLFARRGAVEVLVAEDGVQPVAVGTNKIFAISNSQEAVVDTAFRIFARAFCLYPR